MSGGGWWKGKRQSDWEGGRLVEGVPSKPFLLRPLFWLHGTDGGMFLSTWLYTQQHVWTSSVTYIVLHRQFHPSWFKHVCAARLIITMSRRKTPAIISHLLQYAFQRPSIACHCLVQHTRILPLPVSSILKIQHRQPQPM